MLRPVLDPSTWRFRHFLAIAALLSLVNVFGPKSFVHLFYLKKETEELRNRKDEVSLKILELQRQVQQFENSHFEQQRAIRKHLGYLKENELSLEFNNAR